MPKAAVTHLLFIPSPQGYRLEERSGEAPEQGASVQVGEGGSFVVNRLGPSPYQADQRRCAYLVSAR